MKLNVWWWVATNFNVSSCQGLKLWGLSPWLPSLADPCLTLAWASQKIFSHLTLEKSISVIQSLSVSWCSESLMKMKIQIIYWRSGRVVKKSKIQYCGMESDNFSIFKKFSPVIVKLLSTCSSKSQRRLVSRYSKRSEYRRILIKKPTIQYRM